MTYEIIGKLAVTIGILILILIIWVFGYILLDWITNKIEELPPSIVQEIIDFSLLGLFIIGLGVLIYNVL